MCSQNIKLTLKCDMRESITLFLIIHDSIESESIKNLIYKFQQVRGLGPDILTSRSKKTVALRWKCDRPFSDRASIIHIALEYIYIRYFNLLFSIRKPFGVYSNADVSYLMLLGTCLLPDFPVEKIENTDKFMVENELSVKKLKEKGNFSFYDLFKEHCDLCLFILDRMKNDNKKINIYMKNLAVYYQSCYALLQAVLFSDGDKPKDWDKRFLYIIESIKEIQMPNNDSWVSVIQGL